MPQIGQAWVEIGARTESFDKGVQNVTGQLARVGRTFTAASADTQKLTTATNQAANAFSGFRTRASDASVTAIAFSQGIQDIPYGLRGVVNNVQFTAQSFTQLVATTGSARAAFAALASSLAGPVGILVAFSAATVALQLFTEGSKEAKEEASALEEALSSMVTAKGTEIKVELDTRDIPGAIQVVDQAIATLRERFNQVSLRINESILASEGMEGAITAADIAAAEVLKTTSDQLAEELKVNEALGVRLEALRADLKLREEIAKATDQLVADKLPKSRAEYIARLAGRTGAAPDPRRPGPEFSFPANFFDPFADLEPESFTGLLDVDRQWRDLTPEQRLRVNAGAGILGPGAPGPVIDLSGFEDLEQTTGRLVADLEHLSVDAVIPTTSAFQNLARESVRDFVFELGDATANLVLFGDSLKETLGNIGKRAAGSFLGGLINFGVGSLLDEIPGFSTARNAAAITGASQRPDTSGVTGLNARISLTDIVIEQQRSATRNNLHLVGLQ